MKAESKKQRGERGLLKDKFVSSASAFCLLPSAFDSDRLIKEAKRAIEQNQPHDARTLLQQAAGQNPNDPRIWLLLAGIASSPRAREAYLARAAALRQSDTPRPSLLEIPPPTASPANRRGRWSALAIRGGVVLLLAALLLLAGTFFGAYLTGQPVASLVAGWWPGAALPQTTDPVLAAAADADLRAGSAAEDEVAAPLQPTPTLALAAGEIPPAEAAASGGIPAIVAEATADNAGGAAEEVIVAANDPLAKEIAADSQPRAAWTPTLAPTPTPEPTATPAPVVAGAPVRPAEVGANERWIDVNLTTQTLVALEGDAPALTTLISSGTWLHPTVTGAYRTYMKYESQTMNGYLLGYDYYLEGVPFVMYFYRDYALHGTFWHNNFGTPMSHGCVNMNTADAGWLFNWAPVGTWVNVHY